VAVGLANEAALASEEAADFGLRGPDELGVGEAGEAGLGVGDVVDNAGGLALAGLGRAEGFNFDAQRASLRQPEEFPHGPQQAGGVILIQRTMCFGGIGATAH